MKHHFMQYVLHRYIYIICFVYVYTRLDQKFEINTWMHKTWESKKKKEIYFNILLFQNCIDVKKNFNKKEYFNKNTIKKLVLDIIYRKVILNL